MSRHSAALRLPLWAVLLPVAVGALLFAAGLAVHFTTPAAAAAPGRTVTIPGPTTTVSYLMEVTVTPGRNGY